MIRASMFLAAAVLLTGCGRGPHVPVTGKVFMDGQPLAGATVVFQCSDGSHHAATARTDEQGRFRLATMQVDGAVPGRYRVMVSKPVADGQEQVMPEDYMFEAEASSFDQTEEIVVTEPRQLVPEAYAVYHTTPLRYDIEQNIDNDFAITIENQMSGR